MPKKNSYITVTDQFCGAGGSSQGVRNYANKNKGAVEVKLALNHWKLAIETHNTNFPDTLHECTDISACDPRRYPSTDILITSPECTTHSPAGGNSHKAAIKQIDMFNKGTVDPATERSRATMWDVCRFAEYHNYNIIIAENVVEAKTRWALFENWLSCMHTLGYNHKCVYINSMHCHPTPQSRDRMYVVFWKKGNKAPNLDLTPRAWCQKCSKDVLSVQTWKNPLKKYGKYRQQYVYCCPGCAKVVEPYYYAAFNCIDWSNLGTRIGDRKKPLADKTTARIKYGLEKYGKQPLIVRNQTPGYCRPLDKQIGSITTDDQNAILNMPFIVDGKQTTGIECRVKGIDDVSATMHCDPRVGLCAPVIYSMAQTGRNTSDMRHASEHMPAQTTVQSEALITMPFLYTSQQEGRVRDILAEKNTQTTQHNESLISLPFIPEFHSNGKARSTVDELNTVTAGGIKSGIVSSESWKSFISYYYGVHQASGINEAIGTCSTKDRHQLINYQTPEIEDCYFRMLVPKEVASAMAFEKEYIILGNSKDQVKQCGNAVTPPAMEFLVSRCIESLN